MSYTKEIEKRKIAPEVQEWMKYVKRAINTSVDKVEERLDDIEDLIQNPNRLKDMLEQHKLMLEYKALNQYGALKEKSLDEIENAHQMIDCPSINDFKNAVKHDH